MNIIIAGAGKVGFNLAKTLCVGNNVTIIDKNIEALNRIQESLDILPLNGNVEDYRTYKIFVDKKIDLFIAVTNNDNVNIVAALMIDTILNVKRKFVRLHNIFFANDMIKNKLNIDKIILPIKLTSKSIVTLLNYPLTNNVKFFKYTDFRLISIIIYQEPDQENINLYKTNIIGIERNKQFYIPHDEESRKIQKNDLVYLFVHKNDIETICNALNLGNNLSVDINRCVVFGGGDLGISISKELINMGKSVKLVEKDLKLCEAAEEQLEGKISVINSKYGTTDLFEDEHLADADIFIAASNNDEFNIIKCLEAKEQGINRVVAINNELEHYKLMHSLSITAVRGPKISAYNGIMEHISSNSIVIQKSFCGASGIIFIRKIFPSSHLIDMRIKNPNIKEAIIFYLRNEKLYSLMEPVLLKENDLIVCFSTSYASTKTKQWIYEL